MDIEKKLFTRIFCLRAAAVLAGRKRRSDLLETLTNIGVFQRDRATGKPTDRLTRFGAAVLAASRGRKGE